jgi:hypothetical protein
LKGKAFFYQSTVYLGMIRLLSKFICCLFFFSSFFATGQSTDSLFIKIEQLKKILSRADTLRPGETTLTEENSGSNESEGVDINSLIEDQLADILVDPKIIRNNLDKLLQHDFLGITHSKDKRLWIFTWYENTGGSWKSNISLVHYRTKSNQPKVEASGPADSDSPSATNVFCSNGAGFDKIYKLVSPGKNLYLCLGSGISCNTCIYNIASVVELTNDGINFTYPAFQTNSDNLYPEDDNFSCFVLGARLYDIEDFSFNEKTQTLHMVYRTDDNTPHPAGTKEGQRIVRNLKFNGNKFVGNGYK